MGKKPLTLVGLELGTDHVRLVEMLRDERRVIASGVFPVAFGRNHDREHLMAQVRSAFAVVRGSPRAVIASVPLGQAWLRVLDIPEDAHDDAAVRDHVEWDMSRYLGRDREEIDRDLVLDILAAPGGSSHPRRALVHPRRALVAGFPRAEALALRALVEEVSGAPLVALDVDAAALVNVCAVNHAASAGAAAARDTLVIQAHARATTIVRIRDGAFQGATVRQEDVGDVAEPGALPSGASAAAQMPRVRGVLDALAALASLHAEEEAGEATPSQILLCGELAREGGFRELLRAHLPEPFSLLNPFRNITGPDPMEYPEAYPGAALAVPVGLAWRLAEDMP